MIRFASYGKFCKIPDELRRELAVVLGRHFSKLVSRHGIAERQTKKDFEDHAGVVADANVLLSAIVGKSALRVFAEFAIQVHASQFNADGVTFRSITATSKG